MVSVDFKFSISEVGLCDFVVIFGQGQVVDVQILVDSGILKCEGNKFVVIFSFKDG